MKTKTEREVVSRKRQKVGEDLRVWAQKVKDLTEHPERGAELDFARAELKKYQDAMWELNKDEKRQRAWVSGK